MANHQLAVNPTEKMRRRIQAQHKSALLQMVTLVVMCVAIVACERRPEPASSAVSPPPTFAQDTSDNHELTTDVQQLTEKYLEQIESDFTDASLALETMQKSVEDFLQNPSNNSMEAARDAWLSANIAYELTTLHRYFASRILDEAQGEQWFQLQYQINQWPILPGYIDYVQDYADSGIVNDIPVPLTELDLRAQNGLFEITEATLGFHVIEFLLWGTNADENSPRQPTDYRLETVLSSSQADSGMTVDQISNNRRRVLLELVTNILVDDFASLQSLWAANTAIVRTKLQAMEGPQLLSVIMNSMTDMLSEELLVRSLYPLLNGEYNDSIQSPFSHTTQNAVSAQLSGFERLLLENTTDSGATLDGLISSMSEDFADFFYQNFDASKECLVLLYSTLESPTDSPALQQAEFDIVECINLVSNMIGHLSQIEARTR